MKRLLIGAGTSAGLILLFVLIVRQTSNPSPRPGPGFSDGGRPVAGVEDSAREAVRDLLRSGADLDSCRGLVQQLNVVQSKKPDDAGKNLSDEEGRLLEERFFLDDRELAEVKSRVFTALDAHALDLAFLLSDAANASNREGSTPLDRASAAFDWTMSHVRLHDRSVEALPPVFVIRRSWGSATERAMAFCALLDLMGLDSCMIAVQESAETPEPLRYWIPGVLVEQEIYLFDTRMGIPVPGPNGKGVASLAQARQDPGLLPALTANPKYPYDVRPEHLKSAEVHIAGTLTTLAPRMGYLQGLLAGSERLRLYSGAEPLLKRFEAAMGRPGLAGCKLKAWNHAGDPNSPFRVLRAFLPESEGGIARPDKREQALQQLVPWQFLAPRMLELGGEPGARLVGLFASPFQFFYTEPRMPRERLSFWLTGLFPPTQPGMEQAQPRVPEPLLRGRMPRDLLLRGRFDEATTVLVPIIDELKRQRQEMKSTPNLLPRVIEWCQRAVNVYGTLLRAEQEAANPKSKAIGSPVDAVSAKRDVMELWKNVYPVQIFVLGSAAEPLLADSICLMALCKHEQARRSQAKLSQRGSDVKPSQEDIKAAQALWKTAASWWSQYLGGDLAATSAAQARVLLAEARLNLGDLAGAIALLEDLTGEPTPLEATGRLYQAARLKAR